MTEATIILASMRGGCATVGKTVHTLFRLSSPKARSIANANIEVVDAQAKPAPAQSAATVAK